MQKSIIRIAAVLTGCILLVTGCIRREQLVPETDPEEIRFQAGSTLLRKDAGTKATTEEFTSNEDTFVVFGERVTPANAHNLVFDDVTVRHQYSAQDGIDVWDYTPHRFWDWESIADYYDFVAVSPAGQGTANEHAVGRISIATHYDCLGDVGQGIQPDKYDILAAAYRRHGSVSNPISTVDLHFSHMGSAVGVTIHNISQTKSITVSSLHFKNLVVRANARVTLDNFGYPSYSWVNLERSTADVRRLAKSPATTIVPESQYTGEYQIMIPQDLSIPGANQPTLVLTYTPQGGSETTESIPLRDILQEDSTPITRWNIGVKYHYVISFRLDGGLRVTVTTTPWDVPVEGETPGILI